VLARLPIRLRLTLAFAAAMALVLASVGLVLRVVLAHDLNANIDRGLHARAADVTALAEQADQGLAQAGRSPLTERGQSIAQVLDARGRVLDGTPLLRGRAVLSPTELAAASRRELLVERTLPGFEDRVRLLAVPARAQATRLVVVVGADLEDRDAALHNLTVLLLVVGPLALLATSVAGYGLATAAFRPVESMRRRAARISGQQAGDQLPMPPARDELHRLAATLNEMLGRIDRSMARERAFVSDASHELRTPLAVLKLELELALREGRPLEDVRRAVVAAAEETDRLTQLADDLLVVARADQGRLPIRRETVGAAGLLETLRTRFARRAAEAGREIVVDAPDDLAIRGDAARLEQAIGNLVENAVRHGGGRIHLAAQASDGLVELHVKDGGEGFPPEFLSTAFERFSRADHARTTEGAGLGLAIVRAIAVAHGGAAHARNTEGGADVWISLPAED
jgi:heavy metal sensor kinase